MLRGGEGMRRSLEDLRGVGTLRRNDSGLSVRVRYQVSIEQDQLSPGPGQAPIDGLKSMRVVLRSGDEWAFVDWVGQHATLLLEDGRRVRGFVSDSRGAFEANGFCDAVEA
jgi:hypothetical protein